MTKVMEMTFKRLSHLGLKQTVGKKERRKEGRKEGIGWMSATCQRCMTGWEGLISVT